MYASVVIVHRKWVAGAVGLVVLAGCALGGQATLAGRRTADLTAHRDRLVATWQRDLAEGLPASAVAPLRGQLASMSIPDWWSPQWWNSTRAEQLDALDQRTAEVYAEAVSTARATDQKVVADARALVADAGPLAPADLVGAVAGWDQELRAATSPRALADVSARQQAALTRARGQVQTARTEIAARARAVAEAKATVAASGGPQLMLAEVPGVDRTAADDNLDATPVDQLAAALRAEVDGGQPTAGTETQLARAITAFKQMVAANDRINNALQPLAWRIDGASLYGTPGAAGFQTQVTTVRRSFAAARTPAEIAAVEQQVQGLRAAVDGEMQTATCGHDVGAGKAIVISLSLQHFVAYDNGCAVKDGPVTTGRPQLPTPTGNFHVFYKTTPFTMVSPWPKGSPFWYRTTPVSWVLEFEYGGYFLHDATWEAFGSYGPGSQNNPDDASHGCIHIQTATMEWLYSWTPVGTPVTVVA